MFDRHGWSGKIAFILMALIAPLAAWAGARWLSGERIDSYWTSVQVSQSNEPASIVEVIDYDFGLSARRGILRTVPGLDPISPLTVTSATAPDDVLIQSGFTPTIRIGDPDITIRGRHRYQLEYILNTLVAGDQFSWNAVGTEWEVPISSSEIHLISTNEWLNPRCDTGRFGSIGGCTAEQVSPGHLLVETGRLASGVGVTVSAGIGASLTQLPSLPKPPQPEPLTGGLSVVVPMALAFAGVLITNPLVGRIVRLRGREQIMDTTARSLGFIDDLGSVDSHRLAEEAEMARLIYPSLTPPQGVSAPHGGIIIDERVSQQHLVAWLMEAAELDEIRIDGDPGDTTVLRRGSRARATTKPIIDSIFANSDTVRLSGYDPAFKRSWDALKDDLQSWRQRSGYWDRTGDTQFAAAIALSILFGVLATGAVAVFSGISIRWSPIWLLPMVMASLVLGTALTVLTRSSELRIRTPLGTSKWIEVEALRRFLSELEPESALNMIEPDRFAGYTAWAYAFGLDEKWKAIAKVLETDPRFESVPRHHFYHATIGPSVSRSTQSASTAPSSSSGGGGGGVGGGGGGGGGGSW
ncbi:MAG: DUF2207 domain-containing protein [Acidimicrobiales bacterium]|nr:DUF2207 domain-containing protein [Acidimicrobiales bacterium]